MRRSLIVVGVLLMSLSGCKKDSSSASPSAAASATLKPGQGKMVHCPNAVSDATTDFKDVEGGIEITVTAKDAESAAAIRERAKHLAEVAKSSGAGAKTHDGSGQGGGGYGRCPVVVRDTLIDAVDVEGGSKITVKPKDSAELDWLRREARARMEDLGAPGGRGAGKGRR